MRAAAITAGLAAGVVLVGCGSSGNTAASSPPPVTTSATQPSAVPAVNYGKQYLALVAPVNTALDTLVAKVNKLVGQTVPTSTLVDDAQPTYASLSAFDSAVLRAQWPANATDDIKSLVKADAPLEAALTDDAPVGQAWVSQFTATDTAAAAASNIVRADLGLAAPTS